MQHEGRMNADCGEPEPETETEPEPEALPLHPIITSQVSEPYIFHIIYNIS